MHDESRDEGDLEERPLINAPNRTLEAVVQVGAKHGQGGVAEVDEGKKGEQKSRNGLDPAEALIIHSTVSNSSVNNCQAGRARCISTQDPTEYDR